LPGTPIEARSGAFNYRLQVQTRWAVSVLPGDAGCADPAKEIADMPTKTFTSGRIRRAEYDTTSQQLDLHWDNKTVLTYKQVPEEVYRRLCAAPNPAAYWEDRIAEEYPKGTAKTPGGGTGPAQAFDDLFGNQGE